MDCKMSVEEFFRDRDVFITGGSGFLGKVLIEKLLRSCPRIGRIYMLVRPKKGVECEERMKTFADNPLFDRIKSEGNGHVLAKLVAIKGDISKIGLGLSRDDENLLIENVSVIFHVAASVRFDDNIKQSILTNTRGTREVVNLGLKMKKIAVFAHVSTAYSNCYRVNIEERLYTPLADWRKTIEIVEQTDHYTLDILTAKYIGQLPNTYTFAKHLAEHVVKDMCRDKIPAFILRPSIVSATFLEPIPGWCDSFAGSSGLAAGMSLGVLRLLYSASDAYLDNVPVDACIKAILIASWRVGTERKYPPKRQLWYPTAQPCDSRLLYKLWIFIQLMIFFVLDVFLRFSGRKPMVVQLLRKIYAANESVKFFTFNCFNIVNKNFLDLEKLLNHEDRPAFAYFLEKYDTHTFIRDGMKAGRVFLLKENLKDVEDDEKRAFKNAMKHYIACTVLLALFLWVFFVKWNVLGWFYDAAYELVAF